MKIEVSKTATVLRCRCPLCGEEGILRSLEVLPKHGMAMECIHKDERTHQWAEYDSMEAVIDKNKPKKRGEGPRIINCPMCHKRGRVNEFHPNSARPDIVEYVVTHEKLKGTWGKRGKIARRRRCYVKKQNDRDAVLKKLGRYIPPVNTLEKYTQK